MATDKPEVSGRLRERERLHRALASTRPEFLAIYGRRRVGKTFLIRRWFTGKARFFEVSGRYGGTLADNLRVFADAMSDAFHAGAKLAVPSSWHEAFRALERELERHRSKHKWVLFFDELPWLVTHKSGCLEELEHFWNSWCSKRPNIILIVCGSAASWMLRHVVHGHGGLHNRLTETIRLLPFSLAEAHQFLEDRGVRLTRHQMVELYMVTGGVPHYLEKVRRGQSIAQIINALCFDPDGALAGEFDHLFASLFSDDEIYRRIVGQLARTRYGVPRDDLLRAVGASSGGGINRVLINLEEAGFIQTVIPFGRARRDRFYRLVDEFSLFHLQWLEGRRRGKRGDWTAIRGTAKWNNWAGLAFEALCLKHVDVIERALGISGVRTDASSWQHQARGRDDAGAQIDLLIDRADDVISVCELKHTVNPFTITKRYAEDLRRKLAVFQRETRTRKNLQLVLITTAGVLANAYSRDLVDRQVELDAFWS
jgi:AAA+ ATPase superfamily predicted ATPase